MSGRPSCASGVISMTACAQRAPAAHQQLEHGVERRRVRAAHRDRRQRAGHVVAQRAGGQPRLARPHPADVAQQRVELAVVGAHVERVRQRPAGEGVGREARVHDGQGAGQALVGQVRVVARQLRAPRACPCRRSCATSSWAGRGRRRTRSRPGGGPRTACRSRSSPSSEPRVHEQLAHGGRDLARALAGLGPARPARRAR